MTSEAAKDSINRITTKTVKSRLRCLAYNFLPSYRGSGAWITHISDDWREVVVRLPLNWWTRNYVGTTYCGSMYAAVAPWYMAMLFRNLGGEYLVWDKTVTIRFQKPGQTTLYARFCLDEADIRAIKADLETKRSTERTYTIDLTDQEGEVHASFEEVIYIRRKRAEKAPSTDANT